MANELLINQLVKLTIAGESLQLVQQQLNLDVPSEVRVDKIVAIGTSEEDLDLDDVTLPGLAFLANLDTENFVQFGPKDSGAMVYVGDLPARVDGKPPLFVGPIPIGSGVVLRAIADTAACNVRVIVIEQ